MPLAYYSVGAKQQFWSEHWRGHSVEELLRVAKISPLTDMIFSALPDHGRVLEAGCGLGQYVVFLRELGRQVTGVDWSLDALRECHKCSPTASLAVMDLRLLGFRPGTFAGYISLGVVEHDREGPGAILREARRVLEPGGILILSVPYVNGVRRIGGWWIRRQNRRVREAGGEFYQFAFSRAEGRAFLERNGFRVLAERPYDPARLLRSWARRFVMLGASWQSPRRGEKPVPEKGALGRQGSIARLARRLLYMPPALQFFGHMILFVAIKAG